MIPKNLLYTCCTPNTPKYAISRTVVLNIFTKQICTAVVFSPGHDATFVEKLVDENIIPMLETRAVAAKGSKSLYPLTLHNGKSFSIFIIFNVSQTYTTQYKTV